MSRQNRFDWFTSLSSRRKAKALKPRRLQSQRKLRYESLEDRRLLAITVDTLVDEADGSIVDGDISLRDAIAIATPGETIDFDASLQGGTMLLTQSELAISKSLNIVGPGANLLTIDASGNDPTPTQNNSDGSRIFRILASSGFSPDVTITGLSLTGGDAGNYGGAIYADAGTLTVENSLLTDNFAPQFGGAIHMASGEVIVRNSRVFANSTNGGGGGISSAGSATIEDSILSSNTAANGGGIDIGDGTAGPQHSLVVRRTEFLANRAAAAAGGGLYVHNTTKDVSIEDSLFHNNSAVVDGGGLYIFAPDISAPDPVATARITNTTISGNRADNEGGGIFVVNSGNADISIDHSTFTQNTSDSDNNGVGAGGGLRLVGGSGASLSHTIIAENFDRTGAAPDISETSPISATYSLIGDNTGSGLTSTPDGVPDINGNLIGPAFFQSSLTVRVDVAAMGEFEVSDDTYLFEYAIDDGDFQPLFTSVVEAGSTQDYFLQRGAPAVTLSNPLSMNGELLNNNFRTLTTTIADPGAEVYIRFAAQTNGSDEAFAWRNLSIHDNLGTQIGRVVGTVETVTPIVIDPDYVIADDMFGIRSQGSPGTPGLPGVFADDSVAQPSDFIGIVRPEDSTPFFGVADTKNFVGTDENQAIWRFDFDGLAVNPHLGPVADNGGPTLTHNLLPNSPAIDAGDITIASPPTFDQRSTVFDRIIDGNGDSTPQIDIGAVELQTIDTLPFTLLVDTSTDVYDGNFSSGEVSLREALSFANLVPGADTIDFDPALAGETIGLLRGQLNVSDSLTVNGLGADQLTIDATSNDPSPNVNNGDGSRVIYIGGGPSGSVISVDISGMTLTGGDVTGDGGAIMASDDLQLTDLHVVSNAATDDGGGIHNSGGNTTLLNGNIEANTAGDNGGGIYNVSGGLSLADSTVDGNSAGDKGGGIYFSSFGAPLLIDRTTFSTNTSANEGGGLWSDTALTGVGVGRVINSTFSGNSAAGEGGGIRNWDGLLVIEHSTITVNQAAANQGSGVSGYGDNVTRTHIYSSIVAGNIGTDVDVTPTNVNSFVSLGYNLIGNGNATINFTNNDQTGVDDPLLGPLGDNGGPTFTHALLPGSPAIDESDPTFTTTPIGDQRGDTIARVADGDLDTAARLDIGAYELQPPSAGLAADFDGDTDVDGADFLSWQRGFGTTSGAAKSDGDANSDGAVNGSDLAVWDGTYGQTGGQTFDFTGQLTAYWPFDSGGTDLSGNGLDVNLIGPATTAATGVFGNALTLNNPQPGDTNSATAWAERPIDDDVLDLVSTDFTIQAWFNLADANGTEQTLLDKLQGNGSGGGWTMTVFQQGPQSPAAGHFYTSPGSTGPEPTGFSKISTGVWHNFTVRSDASGVDYFFDGILIEENTAEPAVQAYSEMLRIGRRNPGDSRNIGLNGRIDDVAIWQRGLTDNDIQALWNDGFGRPVIAAAASGQQAAAVSTVATLPELATTSLVEIQHSSDEPEFAELIIATHNAFPANASLQPNTYEQPSTRRPFNPSIARRAYRSSAVFAFYQHPENSTFSSVSRFDSAIRQLTSPKHESEVSHEFVDHAFDELGEEEFVTTLAVI